MQREDALKLVREYVKNENLVRHMLAVEAAMRWYAERLAPEEIETWGLAGILHDFDWEIHPTLEQHPQEGETGGELTKTLPPEQDSAGGDKVEDGDSSLTSLASTIVAETSVASIESQLSTSQVEMRIIQISWCCLEF